MRTFIVLCLVAVSCTEQFGYNYPSADGSNQLFVLNTGHDGLKNIDLTEFDKATQSGSPLQSQRIHGDFDRGTYAAPTLLSSAAVLSEPNQPASATFDPSYSLPVSSYNKEFFSFSAPDEDFLDPAASEKILNSLKQALRVIFIKGPENKALENAALSLARQASNQRTAIYVLNKQSDIADLANKLNVIRNNNNSKPEVHFVKYRTPEDAANAQDQIASQYNSLSGSSRTHDGVLAPVINFASQVSVKSEPAPRSPDNSYLPTSIFRRH